MFLLRRSGEPWALWLICLKKEKTYRLWIGCYIFLLPSPTKLQPPWQWREPRSYMNRNLSTVHIMWFTVERSDHSRGRQLGALRMYFFRWTFEKVQLLAPLKSNANSPTAIPSKHDFVEGKSGAISIQAKPLMMKKKKKKWARKQILERRW